jgi:hypothetical protein
MEDKNVKSILEDALEEEIPSSKVKLWSGVKERLVVGRNISTQQGKKMNITKQDRVLRMAFATLTVAALLVIAFTTPRGQAFAQSILRFFIRTKSDRLPLQPWQLTPFPTPTIPVTMLSMMNAEELVRFDARELIAVPAGLALQGTHVEEEVIYIEYASADNKCRLTLAQTLNIEYPNANLWSRFSAKDIQRVKVGEFNGELIHDVSNATPIIRLRWQQPDDGAPPLSSPFSSSWRPGHLSLELVQACPPDSVGYFNDKNLLDLAQRTVHTLWADSLVSLEQAEDQVGFSALQLPHDNDKLFTFAGASVDPQYRLLTLVYHSPDGSTVQSGRAFTLRQWPTTEPLETCDLCAAIGASAEITTVSVRGTTGEYVQGVWELSNTGPIWQPVPHRKTIRWQEDGYWFELSMWTSDGSHTMEGLIAVAENLK